MGLHTDPFGFKPHQHGAGAVGAQQLRWWLRSFGSEVEVLRPVRLRREFGDAAKRIAGRYRK